MLQNKVKQKTNTVPRQRMCDTVVLLYVQADHSLPLLFAAFLMSFTAQETMHKDQASQHASGFPTYLPAGCNTVKGAASLSLLCGMLSNGNLPQCRQ